MWEKKNNHRKQSTRSWMERVGMVRGATTRSASLTAMLLCQLGSPTQAVAATYTITASRDSLLKQAGPNDNFRSDTELLIKNSSGSDLHRPIYGFTLPALPAGEVVVSATLRLYVTQSDSELVSVHRVTDTWAENTVTWGNTGTDLAATAEGSFTPSSGNRTLDITSLVQDWYNGVVANNGIVLTGPSGMDAKFTSREWGTANQRPRLTITTTSVVPLSVTKTASAYFDPLNGLTNPKIIPGGQVAYTVRVFNNMAYTIDGDSIVIVDPTPAGLQLFVGDVPGGSGPALFTTSTSGLTYTYSGLSSMTDDIDFSNDGGVSWTYVPIPDAFSADGNVTHMRISPKGTMAAGSNFFVQFGYQVP